MRRELAEESRSSAGSSVPGTPHCAAVSSTRQHGSYALAALFGASMGWSVVVLVAVVVDAVVAVVVVDAAVVVVVVVVALVVVVVVVVVVATLIVVDVCSLELCTAL